MLNKKIFRKCLEFWENEKLNIIYLERARKSLSFFVEKLKKGEKMSDNIEIVMDIDSLEIFDVIDLDKNENMVDCIPEGNSDEKVSVYDELNRVWLGDGYYYRPSSLLWRVMKDDVIHELCPRINIGTYPYSRRARDGTWGQTSQLTQAEALWLTLEFNPELMGYV